MADVGWAKLPIGQTLRVQATGAVKTKTGHVFLSPPLMWYDEDDPGDPTEEPGQMMIRADQVSGKRITKPIRLLAEWAEIDGKSLPVWSILPCPADWPDMHVGEAAAGGGGWKGKGGKGGKPQITRAQWEEAMRQSFELSHVLTGEKPGPDAVFEKVAGCSMFVKPGEWKGAVGKALEGHEIPLGEPETPPPPAEEELDIPF